VKIVVDTNIVFSGLLTPNGKISDLLMNSDNKFEFYSPQSILEELDRHHNKLCSISKLQTTEINFLKRLILKKINIIDLEIVSIENWHRAIELTNNIDEFDAPFIALSLELDASLWTGDKKLINGLSSLGINWVLNTSDVQIIRDEYTID
jgi:putative PIN family toxin of toxin-antitoxin system